MKEGRTITILINCHDLPKATFGSQSSLRLGIQKGQEVNDDVPVEGAGAMFQATLEVESRKTGEPSFRGPYVHGKPSDRFLYLCWGRRTAEHWELLGRAKVSLANLGWKQLEQAWDAGKPVTLSVAMTDSRGRAACGLVASE